MQSKLVEPKLTLILHCVIKRKLTKKKELRQTDTDLYVRFTLTCETYTARFYCILAEICCAERLKMTRRSEKYPDSLFRSLIILAEFGGPWKILSWDGWKDTEIIYLNLLPQLRPSPEQPLFLPSPFILHARWISRFQVPKIPGF